MKILRMLVGGGSWFDHVVSRRVGHVSMFDHNEGGGIKISENLTTWYMDAPSDNKKLVIQIFT